MFYYCRNMTSLVISASVIIIDGNLAYTSGLTSVEFENPTNWLQIYYPGNVWNVSNTDFSEDGTNNGDRLKNPYYTYFEKLD